MTPEQHDQITQVLAELLPDWSVPDGPKLTAEMLARAASIIAERHNKAHRALHADVQRGGALVLAMREEGMSWSQIRAMTGIYQRTGGRWIKLFLKEGITPRPDDELDVRWQGRQE
jgi:hypothetical protein